MTEAGYETLELYINGQFCKGSTGVTEEVINPATEKTVGVLPHASRDDLDRTLEAAQAGFKVWSAMTALERGRILRKVADIMREKADHIGRIMTIEQGKPLIESKIEVIATADTIEWMAEEGKRAYGRIIPSRFPGHTITAVPEPVGVAAAFAPWNFPALMPGRKIAYALAAGCSIIVKPSEETPGTAVAIARVCEEAGVPKGVVNVVFGVPAEVSEYLIASPIVRKISFTGSIAVGKHLMGLAAKGMKKVTMELGGHSPVVIFDDVDVDQVVASTIAGKYRNAGQVCIAPTRFYVHENIHDRFVDAFAKASKAMKVGNGLESGVQMGPLANPRRIDAMEDFIGDAKAKGARIVAGGNRIANQGFFWEPTVLADIPDDAKMMTIEPFGPVAPVQRWKDFDEVIAKSNALEYGLAAYAFTRNGHNAKAVAEKLEAGMIGVNSFAINAPEAPFGGNKESGIGREAGIEGMMEFMNVKQVAHLDPGA